MIYTFEAADKQVEDIRTAAKALAEAEVISRCRGRWRVAQPSRHLDISPSKLPLTYRSELSEETPPWRHAAASYPIVIRDLEVIEAFNVTPLMRRIVVSGEQLAPFVNNGIQVGPFLTENADDHVKVVVGNPGVDFPVPGQEDGHLDWSREALDHARDYTPRRFDPVTGRRA